MLLGIDHVVILVNDLATASADYTALGFTVAPGGEHSGGATHNALIAFADGSYLELLAFKQPDPNHRWWHYTALGEGLVDFALLPSAIEHDLEAARQRGLELQGPTPGGRQRPDGQQIKWQIATPTTPDLPFLCGDITPRSLRVPDQTYQQHSNGVSGIAYLHIGVSDFQASVARYKALTGVEPQIPDSLLSIDENQIAGFRLNPEEVISSTIILTEPKSSSSLANQLKGRGDGPFQLTLRQTDQSTALPNFTKITTHGVQFDFAK